MLFSGFEGGYFFCSVCRISSSLKRMLTSGPVMPIIPLCMSNSCKKILMKRDYRPCL